MNGNDPGEQASRVAKTMGWSLDRAEAFLRDLKGSTHAIIAAVPVPARKVGAEEAYERLLSDGERRANREKVSSALEEVESEAAGRGRSHAAPPRAYRGQETLARFDYVLIFAALVLNLAERLLPMNHSVARALHDWAEPALFVAAVACAHGFLNTLLLERKGRETD